MKFILLCVILACLATPLYAGRVATGTPVSDLPLIEFHAQGTQHQLVIIISGDGGWADIDRTLAGHLFSKGASVVGLDSLQYFWKARKPEEMATDLGRIMKYYLAAWKKDQAVIMGYSMGAEVIPFMVNRLSAENQKRISGLVLIGPSNHAVFEFHITQWLGDWATKKGDEILPEVQKIKNEPILCVDSEDHKTSLCRQLDGLGTLDDTKFEVQWMGVGHHFAHAHKDLFEMIGKKMNLE